MADVVVVFPVVAARWPERKETQSENEYWGEFKKERRDWLYHLGVEARPDGHYSSDHIKKKIPLRDFKNLCRKLEEVNGGNKTAGVRLYLRENTSREALRGSDGRFLPVEFQLPLVDQGFEGDSHRLAMMVGILAVMSGKRVSPRVVFTGDVVVDPAEEDFGAVRRIDKLDRKIGILLPEERGGRTDPHAAYLEKVLGKVECTKVLGAREDRAVPGPGRVLLLVAPWENLQTLIEQDVFRQSYEVSPVDETGLNKVDETASRGLLDGLEELRERIDPDRRGLFILGVENVKEAFGAVAEPCDAGRGGLTSGALWYCRRLTNSEEDALKRKRLHDEILEDVGKLIAELLKRESSDKNDESDDASSPIHRFHKEFIGLLREKLGARRGVIRLVDPEGENLAPLSGGKSPEDFGYDKEQMTTFREVALDRSQVLAARAVHDKKTYIIQSTQNNQYYDKNNNKLIDLPYKDVEIDARPHSAAALVLQDGDSVYGAVTLAWKEVEQEVLDHEDLLVEVARRISVPIKKWVTQNRNFKHIEDNLIQCATHISERRIKNWTERVEKAVGACREVLETSCRALRATNAAMYIKDNLLTSQNSTGCYSMLCCYGHEAVLERVLSGQSYARGDKDGLVSWIVEHERVVNLKIHDKIDEEIYPGARWRQIQDFQVASASYIGAPIAYAGEILGVLRFMKDRNSDDEGFSYVDQWNVQTIATYIGHFLYDVLTRPKRRQSMMRWYGTLRSLETTESMADRLHRSLLEGIGDCRTMLCILDERGDGQDQDPPAVWRVSNRGGKGEQPTVRSFPAVSTFTDVVHHIDTSCICGDLKQVRQAIRRMQVVARHEGERCEMELDPQKYDEYEVHVKLKVLNKTEIPPDKIPRIIEHLVKWSGGKVGDITWRIDGESVVECSIRPAEDGAASLVFDTDFLALLGSFKTSASIPGKTPEGRFFVLHVFRTRQHSISRADVSFLGNFAEMLGYTIDRLDVDLARQFQCELALLAVRLKKGENLDAGEEVRVLLMRFGEVDWASLADRASPVPVLAPLKYDDPRLPIRTLPESSEQREFAVLNGGETLPRFVLASAPGEYLDFQRLKGLQKALSELSPLV